VRYWEEPIDFMEKNGDPKEPYLLTSMFTVISEEDKIDE